MLRKWSRKYYLKRKKRIVSIKFSFKSLILSPRFWVGICGSCRTCRGFYYSNDQFFVIRFKGWEFWFFKQHSLVVKKFTEGLSPAEVIWSSVTYLEVSISELCFLVNLGIYIYSFRVGNFLCCIWGMCGWNAWRKR